LPIQGISIIFEFALHQTFMTSSEFSRLVQNFPLVGSERIPDIENQLLDAPYCQTFHLLLARSKKDVNDPAATGFIQRAALYASDRPHLKYLLEQSVENEKSGLGSKQAKIILPAPGTESEKKDVPVMIPDHETPVKKGNSDSKVEIADVLMMDLDILKEKTRAFVELTAEKVSRKSTTPAEKITESGPELKNASVPLTKPAKATDDNDLLLLEIKSARKKIKPENPRKAEQIEIIDQFIKARQVTIRPPEKPMPKQDLAEAAESYSENVISETLVEILVRQGKKEKAMDVLKKLIWKFPQKKHLFAARIQELSK
jgi:hypothetical protein